MSDTLVRVLLQWCAALHHRGLPTPPEADLMIIGRDTRSWPEQQLDRVTTSWRPTIEYLQKQVRFGVSDPIAHMADELWILPSVVADDRAEGQSTPVAAVRQTPNTAEEPSVSTHPDAAARSAGAASKSLPVRVSRLETMIYDLRRQHPEIKEIRRERLRAIASANPSALPKILDSLGLSDYEVEIRNALGIEGAVPASDQPQDFGWSADPTSAPSAGSTTSAGLSTPSSPTFAQPAGPESTTSARSSVLDGESVDSDGFAPFDFSGPVGDPAQLGVMMTSARELQINWRAEGGQNEVEIYRVIASDAGRPWSPESGRVVAITTALDAIDTAQFEGAVRHLQVWANTGPDMRTAKLSQPRCVAERAVVCPVLDVSIREEAGSVTGEWEVPYGVERVQIYRVPSEKAHQGSLSPMHRILAEEHNLDGFQDLDADRGKRYLYQFVTEAEIDGVTHTSTPVVREQLISVVLARVEDLVVDLYSDGGEQYFDINWTPPKSGRVAVYRSQQPPTAGIEDEVRDEQRLAGANLLEDDRLAPIRRNVEPDRDGMRRVAWPTGWARAYFTPVTTHAGTALVGKTVALTRVPEITDATLIERINEQLLTFTWPNGAAAVFGYVGRRNVPVSVEDLKGREPAHTLDRETWETQGGLHISPPLHPDGCSLHLVPVAFQAANSFRGPVSTVDYAGVRIVRYQLETKRNRLTLRMGTDTVNNMPELRFALVANSERFPLDIRDGSPISLTANVNAASAATTVTPTWQSDGAATTEWTADIGALRGRWFVRLFVDLPPERLARIALLDPAMESLWLER